MAMERFLALNPTCYLARPEPWVVTALAENYPDAARLLLSLETSNHQEVSALAPLVSLRGGG
jgi:hypothetical protein